MTLYKLFLVPLMFSLSTSALAVTRDEPLTKNPSYKINTDQRSVEIQGLGNKILDAATAPKYLVRVDPNNGTEYAYNLKRITISPPQYSGNPQDIAGYIFFKLNIYIDGTKIQEQTTAFIPSEYSNAIKFLKMDRDEKDSYDFDLGINDAGRLFIITSADDVVYLDPKEVIKKPTSNKEKTKDLVF